MVKRKQRIFMAVDYEANGRKDKVDQSFLDGDVRRVGEILPDAFGLFFCEMAVEDDPAVAEGVGVAGFEEPVAVFGWGEVGEEVTAAVGAVGPDAEGFGVVVVGGVGEQGGAAEGGAQGALDDAPAGFGIVGVAAVFSFGGEDLAIVAVPFGRRAPAEAAVAVSEKVYRIGGGRGEFDRDVEDIVIAVEAALINSCGLEFVEKYFFAAVFLEGDVLLEGLVLGEDGAAYDRGEFSEALGTFLLGEVPAIDGVAFEQNMGPGVPSLCCPCATVSSPLAPKAVRGKGSGERMPGSWLLMCR